MSYARSDQAFALRFAHDLKAAGVEVWVDQSDIGIGQNWDRAVEAAVRACEGFIIILSPSSVSSENVGDEASVAIDGGKQIIPILYEECTVPMRLARVQSIDATSDYEAAVHRCASLILGAKAAAGVVPISPPAAADTVPEPAGAPEGLSNQVLDEAEQKLMVFVGPVAKLLVQKAAVGANSEAELYRQLAVAIPRQRERLTFLKSVSTAAAVEQPDRAATSDPTAATSGALSAESVDKLCQILTAYLGPIARHVLISEARKATSSDDLCQRLAARISSDKERAELLRKLRSQTIRLNG